MSWRFIISFQSHIKPEHLALLTILILAAALRFAYPGVNSFAGDEAHISLDALRMARGGEFVMAGQPSSVNIPFFPASVWLFALPYAVSPDPLVATWFVCAISLLTVVGMWCLARRWNVWAGLIAALYMAASPYAVFYGRSIWQPNLLAPLSLLWAITAYLGVIRTDWLGKVSIGASVFLGLFVVQVHFAGIVLVPATAYLFIRFGWWRRAKIVPVLIGGALALAAMIPYCYYIAVLHPEIIDLYKQVLGGGTATIDLQGVQNLLQLGLGWDWAFIGMGDQDTVSRNVPTAVVAGALIGLGLIAVVVMLVRSMWAHSDAPLQPLTPNSSPTRAGRGEKSIKPVLTEANARNGRVLAEIVILWLIISPLVFLRHSTPVLIHYQLVELPALALIMGASTLVFGNVGWRRLVAIAMILQAAVWSVEIIHTLDYTSVNRPANSALSSILSESRNAAYTPPQPILFFTHGDDPAVDGEAAVFKALLWAKQYRILNGDNLLILPPYPATLLATLSPFQAWEEVEAAGLAKDVQSYPRRVGADPFVSTYYDGESDPQGFTPLKPIPFADGATLIGWKVRRVGPRLRLSTLWTVNSGTAPRTYQQFDHLRLSTNDASDAPLAISDVALSRQTWQVGDKVIVMADFFNIAAGTPDLTIDIGHYTLPDMARIPIDGLSGSMISLGPFTAP